MASTNSKYVPMESHLELSTTRSEYLGLPEPSVLSASSLSGGPTIVPYVEAFHAAEKRKILVSAFVILSAGFFLFSLVGHSSARGSEAATAAPAMHRSGPPQVSDNQARHRAAKGSRTAAAARPPRPK